MGANRASAIAGCLSTLSLAGCLFGGDSGDDGGGRQGAGRIQLVPSVSGSGALARVGSSGATGLQSFQVPVSHIMLAKGLTTSGSGWSDMQGPLALYTNDAMGGDFNSIPIARARDAAWRTHFIDFCDRNDVRRLATSQPFTARDTGDYNWVVVNWAPYFRVRAAIPLSGGDTLFTRDGEVTRYEYPNSTNAYYYVTRAAGSLLQGPAEDAVVQKNNGGTWFRFLRPLRLTEADLDTTALIPDTTGFDSSGAPIIARIPSGRWNVLLVFNPQDLVFGGHEDSSNSSVMGEIRSADSSAYFSVPFLKATAVPYREGEAIMRETYEFAVTVNEAWMRGTYGMRLEIYLNGDNVVAATVTSYPTDGDFAPPEVPVIFFAEDRPDGALDLLNHGRSPVFDGFVRKTTAGQTGTVTWNSGGHAATPQSVGYRLTDIRRMN
jgi:hypothetical protein